MTRRSCWPRRPPGPLPPKPFPCWRKRDTPPQSSLTQGRQRRANVAGVYTAPHPAQVAGQRILLLDDILTTGATLNEAARTLRQAGARQVVAAAFCRTPPKNP